MRSSLNILLICLAATLCGAPVPAPAQRDVWQQANQQKQGVRTSITGKANSWKQKTIRWGLDSNFRHALALGARLHSNGWSGLLIYQRRISSAQTHVIQLSFSEIIHEKQIRQEKENKAFPEFGRRSPFFYGKINHLYTLQAGYGRYRMLLPGLLDGNMSVGLRMHAGFSLAMLKPYYLKLLYTDRSGSNRQTYIREEKYTEDNSETFLKAGSIFGASAWSKGLNELSLTPGGYAEVSAVLEPVTHKMFIQSVTIGGQAACYLRPQQIMAELPAYPWQASFFIGLDIGKRWR